MTCGINQDPCRRRFYHISFAGFHVNQVPNERSIPPRLVLDCVWLLIWLRIGATVDTAVSAFTDWAGKDATHVHPLFNPIKTSGSIGTPVTVKLNPCFTLILNMVDSEIFDIRDVLPIQDPFLLVTESVCVLICSTSSSWVPSMALKEVSAGNTLKEIQFHPVLSCMVCWT